MSKQKGESMFWGFVLLVIGIFFLINNLGWADIDIWEFMVKFWPVILIYIGVKNIIIYAMKRK